MKEEVKWGHGLSRAAHVQGKAHVFSSKEAQAHLADRNGGSRLGKSGKSVFESRQKTDGSV